MGRPLKTKKYNAPVNVDYGFPNDGTTDNDWDDNQPGVTGGWDSAIRVTANVNLPGPGTITAATNTKVVTGGGDFDYCGLNSGSVIYVNGSSLGTVDTVDSATQVTLLANAASNASGASFTFDTTAQDAYILRQKGKRKFMVALNSTIQDEGIAAGGKYFLSGVGTTNWPALGAGPDAAYGKVFTATADGVGLTTTGTVNIVDVCTLVDGTPNAGEVQIEVYNNGTTTNAYTLTNHWVRDFDNTVTPEDGTNTKYVATIFNDSGNTVPDPAGANDKVWTIVGIENWC